MIYINEDRRDDIREWLKVDEDKIIRDYSADDILSYTFAEILRGDIFYWSFIPYLPEYCNH